MSPAAPRRVALDALRAVRAGELADRALAARVDALEPRERAWTWELVMGTLRLRGRLDAALAPHVRRGLDGLDADVLDVLRLGAYQLLEMGSVPAYAAISESVELARAAGAARAAGLVNGVLRALQRAGEPDPPGGALERLTGRGSHPEWLVRRWLERWSEAEVEALVDADNRRPELYLRPIGVSAAEALERLEAAGLEAERVDAAPDAIRLGPDVSAEAALAAVPAMVQDPAATLVVRYAAVQAGATVADLCAAPGGKAFGLADGAGFVVAADPALSRLARIAESRERLGAGDVALLCSDARTPPLREAAFDAVLLDVPCTGTGTLRRHSDARWRVRPEDLDSLARLQCEILDAAATLVRPGGELVYATCSLEPEENEAQVEAFLARHAEFRPRRGDDGIDEMLIDDNGFLAVLPQRSGFDGAFAARLERAD